MYIIPMLYMYNTLYISYLLSHECITYINSYIIYYMYIATYFVYINMYIFSTLHITKYTSFLILTYYFIYLF
jgi:hypothetical protein